MVELIKQDVHSVAKQAATAFVLCDLINTFRHQCRCWGRARCKLALLDWFLEPMTGVANEGVNWRKPRGLQSS